MARDDEPEEDRPLLPPEYDLHDVMEAGLAALDELKNNGPLKWVMEKAKADAMVAIKELVACDASDFAKVRDLQWGVGRYNAMIVYVSEIVEEGRDAFDTLRAELRHNAGEGPAD